MRRSLLFLALLILTTTAWTADDGPVSVEQTLRGVRFRASLEKSTFVDREPVILTLTLTNTTDKEIILGEPADFWTSGFRIIRGSGKEMPGGIELMMPEMPSDYGRVFEPGESYSVYWNIRWRWDDDFPVDSFTLKVPYHSDPDAVHNRRIQWKGRIDLPALSFRTVPPRNDREKAAYQLFVDDPCLSLETPSPYLRLIVLHTLADPEWGGVFASRAGFMEVEELKKHGTREAYLKALGEYAEKHKGEPYYCRTALGRLGDELLTDAKYAEARAVYQKLPDSYYNREDIKRCDEHLTE